MCDLSNPIYHDADKAREHLESIRWPDGPICPHCGVLDNATALKGEKHRPGLYKCKDCRKQFSVTVGTVVERSKIPLNKWLLATHLMTSSKKGISSHQIHRNLGVTYKTAWFMTHRIREAMKDTGTDQLGGPGTSGIVEADEIYIGRTRGHGKGAHISKKQQVVALVEREGRVRAFHIAHITAETLKPILNEQIAKSARLMTDSAGLYIKIGRDFASHETVNHMAREYARGDVTTNTVEGYFGILKRGLKGVYQHVSPAHLHRYVNEFSFRYNNRVALDIDDRERCRIALEGISGKRLTYRRPAEAHA
jgi:transposase-like protein